MLNLPNFPVYWKREKRILLVKISSCLRFVSYMPQSSDPEIINFLHPFSPVDVLHRYIIKDLRCILCILIYSTVIESYLSISFSFWILTYFIRLKAEWLYSQGRGRQYHIGEHTALVQYLCETCPSASQKLVTEQDRKLRLILLKAQQHQQQLKQEQPGEF